MKEFIEKYGNDKDMLLKILKTIFMELVVRLDKESKEKHTNNIKLGRLTAWRDLLDYFDPEFLEENLNILYLYYSEELEKLKIGE